MRVLDVLIGPVVPFASSPASLKHVPLFDDIVSFIVENIDCIKRSQNLLEMGVCSRSWNISDIFMNLIKIL